MGSPDNAKKIVLFDSKDFRTKFPEKYASAPCRYSMAGGVLVEIGVAVNIVTDIWDEIKDAQELETVSEDAKKIF